MICKACGHVCSDDSQFCPQCGLPLSIDDTFDAEPCEGPDLRETVPSVGPADDACSARPTAPEGLVSWDREFPTAQITAVMQQVDPGDGACEASDGSAEPCGDAGGEARDGRDDGGSDGTCDGSSDVDAGDDAPGAVSGAYADDCAGEDADADAGDHADADADTGAEADADTDADAAPQDEGEASEGPGDSCSSSCAEDPEDGDPGDGPGGSVDRSALTARLERVPQPGLGSTAVIPSISQTGPARFSDFDRDKADAARKLSLVVARAVLGVAAAAAVLVGVRLAVFNVEVPQVVDSPSSEARARLDRAGFQVQVESKVTEDAEDAEDGTVLACDPQGGSKQRKGAVVTLTVAASQTIPDVVGMDLDAARAMLEEQGASKVKVTLKESNQPENTIVAVAPEVGQPFSLEEEIVLTVATTAYMPDVVGSTEKEAKKLLEEAGYVPETQWTESQEPAGTVVATDPEAGELANIGSSVTLTVVAPGPSTFMYAMDYYGIEPADLSRYLKWKGFSVAGSFSYTDDWDGNQYVSQKWKRADGVTVSFTPDPYLEDDVLDMADYMAQGTGFQGVRIFVPASSPDSLGTDLTKAKVEEYMEACGLQGMTDYCTGSDLDYNGKSGNELGIGEFICAQGTQDGKVWTVLITPDGAYIGSGGYECYPDMEPICDCVAVNEIFAK